MKKEPTKSSLAFTLIKLAVFALLCGVIYLNYIGQLEPAVKFLDSPKLTFTAGKFKISLYEIIVSITTIVVTLWAASIISDFGESRIRKFNRMNSANKALLSKFYQITVYLLAVFIGLSLVGMDFGVLAIFGGALGIGIGFGLQKITSNFISGLILLFEKSITAGDMIELDDGTTGFIKHISGRFTLMETTEGKEVMIPNEDFITGRVISWTYTNSSARIEIKVGVSYDTDLEQAKQIMLETAKKHPRCIAMPEPLCHVIEFGESAVNMRVLFWVADVTEGRWGPKSDVMIEIFKQFKAAGIVIPFPQREMRVVEAKPEKKPA